MSRRNTPEQNRRYYQNRKERNLCVGCGKERDIPTSSLCSVCTDRRRIEMNKTHEFRRNMGFCPRCGVNKLFGDEKNCPECRAYTQDIYEKWQKKNPEKIKQYYKIKGENIKAKRKSRLEQGLCTYCGKEIDEEGFTRCSKCRARLRNKQRTKRAENYIEPKTQVWRSNGWCIRCGNPERKGDFKLCEDCYNRLWDISHNEKAYAARQGTKDREHIRIVRGGK